MKYRSCSFAEGGTKYRRHEPAAPQECTIHHRQNLTRYQPAITTSSHNPSIEFKGRNNPTGRTAQVTLSYSREDLILNFGIGRGHPDEDQCE